MMKDLTDIPALMRDMGRAAKTASVALANATLGCTRRHNRRQWQRHGVWAQKRVERSDDGPAYAG